MKLRSGMACLGALLGLLLACSAQAQRHAPGSDEVNASYCIAVHGAFGREFQILGALPAPRATQDANRETAAMHQREARRLREFLVPRMKYLDGAELLAATDRGQAEADSVIKTQAECRNRCDAPPARPADASAAVAGATCMRRCIAMNPAAERVAACNP